MSTLDLKGLDNTSRIPKLVYTKSRSRRETEEDKGSKNDVNSPLSPTASQMIGSYPDV